VDGFMDMLNSLKPGMLVEIEKQHMTISVVDYPSNTTFKVIQNTPSGSFNKNLSATVVKLLIARMVKEPGAMIGIPFAVTSGTGRRDSLLFSSDPREVPVWKLASNLEMVNAVTHENITNRPAFLIPDAVNGVIRHIYAPSTLRKLPGFPMAKSPITRRQLSFKTGDYAMVPQELWNTRQSISDSRKRTRSNGREVA